MAEHEFSEEQLSSMVKVKAVENYGGRGREITGDDNLMRVYNEMERVLGFTENKPREGHTRLGVVPLSSSSVSEAAKAGFNPQDAAVCISFRGVNLDKFQRPGDLSAVMVMSGDDANSFVEGVKESPGLVYELIRRANGGPIKRENGQPADIRPGKAVEIMANNSVGGNIQASESAPFSSGFEPNPMF